MIGKSLCVTSVTISRLKTLSSDQTFTNLLDVIRNVENHMFL